MKKTINPSTSLGASPEPAEGRSESNGRSRTIKLFTLGCKVNQYETQGLRERLIGAGFKEIDNGKRADIYLVNTCTVTHRADAASLSFIRKARRENPKAGILVTGCLTEKDENKIRGIDSACLIIKNKDKQEILKSLADKFHRETAIKKGISYFKGHTRAFLKIQDGCNNHCSYCKVPNVRGRSKSRQLKEIIEEAQLLVKNNFKEIVLCGICLGGYGKDLKPKKALIDVVDALEKIEGLLRIRLSSIDPDYISGELIKKIALSKKICRHLHLPLQSGDNEILKKMNRHYTCDDFLNLALKLKKAIPQIAITTDVMAGFPGESDKNFKNTLRLIKMIVPLKAHVFPFSEREGTAAAYLKGKVSPLKIKERAKELSKASESCTHNFLRQFINKDMKVLFESAILEGGPCWEGHTDNYIKVRVYSDLNLKNQLISVRLKKLYSGYITADMSRKRFP